MVTVALFALAVVLAMPIVGPAISSGFPTGFRVTAHADEPVSLAAAAVLPGARAVQVGATATAFASLIAGGSGTGVNCFIQPTPTSLPAGTSFLYQQTDPSTNVPVGQPNTLFEIPGGATRSFVIAFTPTAPFTARTILLAFDCANTSPVPAVSGVNTFLLTSTSQPGPDIVALVATVNNDGIASIPGTSGTGFFSVATANVGASGPITVTVDAGALTLPVVSSLCQTNPLTGVCINPVTPAASAIVQIDAHQTPTFAVFLQGTGQPIPFLPDLVRAFVRFKTGGGVTVGSTSVAVRTQ